ncbi:MULTISPECIES: YjdF family protein [Paenibacillus]|uniref:YjdF family protein n=1 Tax=Paenibacillus residui TaxID=629724 RepID=A0ABW3DAD1_9BACL
MKMTVYHDGQFWVGIIELHDGGKLKAGRYVFGAEPKDQEILDFVNSHLLSFCRNLSQEVSAGHRERRRINPKRIARLAAREMNKPGAASAAHQAIQLEYEKRKKEKKVFTREQREKLKEHKREIARQKAKAKHRGK